MAGRMSKAAKRGGQNNRGPRNLPHLANRLFATPLLIDERKLDVITSVFAQKLNGEADQQLSAGDFREPGEMEIDTVNGIAIIPVIGSLVRRPTMLDAWSGLTSYGEIEECLECALSDARVKAILFQIDSFGGEAGGCFELCDKIFQARSKKPIWAVADIDALSAGYAILSSAEQCFVAPRGSAGSIGVISVHCERSQANAAMGVTYTVLRAGERKGDFNPYERLAPEAAQKALSIMDRTRQVFAQTVSRNRGSVSVQAILETEGQWYDPEDALSLGLIDGIATYETVFDRLAAKVVADQPPDDPDNTAPAPIEPGGEPAVKSLPYDDGREDDDNPEDDDDMKGGTMDPKDDANKPAEGATAVPVTTAVPAAASAGGTVVSLDSVREPAQSRELQIAQLCKLSGFPALAPDFMMNAALSVDDVRDKLQTMRAEKDAALGDISNNAPTGGAANGTGIVSPGAPPSPAALASWQPHLKAAQATNPKFIAPALGR
jgi:ClpP class serine protease